MNSNRFLAFALAASLLFGCEAAVGDKCSTSNDCPNGTTCDTDSPSGYCLATGCESDEECPENSTCVEFAQNITYCLLKCKNSSDCRSGYTCRDDLGSTKFCYVEPDGVYGRETENQIDFVPPQESKSHDENENNDKI